METPENKVIVLVEQSNKYGRNHQTIEHLTEQEIIIARLKGYEVWEVEELNGIYVRKLK